MVQTDHLLTLDGPKGFEFGEGHVEGTLPIVLVLYDKEVEEILINQVLQRVGG